MQYLGGKSKIGYKIACYLNYIRQPGQVYWEPFVGAGWVTQYIKDPPIYCSDKNEYLIAMWQKLMEGWVPPDVVTKEMHQRAKHGEYSPEMTAFIGFGCSFGGNWFDSYAQCKANYNYARMAQESLLRKIELLSKKATFFSADFLDVEPPSNNCLIYCDPPYNGMKEYSGVTSFNSSLFWEKVKDLESRGHTVVISENEATSEFSLVNVFNIKVNLSIKKKKETRSEKLFRYGNHPYFGSETIELW